MAPTVQPYLEITDTITSIMIMNPAFTTPAQIATLNYKLAYSGWSPKIATRSKNPFGLPYQPVLEEMTIDIRGSTAEICYQKLQALNTLLDQGERWYNNEIVAPVFVRYQPKGSNLATYLKDMVIGGFADDSNADLVTLPDNFNITGEINYLKSVRVRFWRRLGLWISATETVTVAAKTIETTYVPAAWSVASPQLSPIDIGFAISGTLKGVTEHPTGLIIVAQRTEYITLYEGAAGVTSLSLSGTVDTADTAAQATNGRIGRVALTTIDTTVIAAGTGANMGDTEYNAVYLSCRISADINVIAHLEISFNSAFVTDITLADVTITYNGGLPQIVFAGIFPTDNVNYTRITMFIRSASGTPNFDIDELVVVGVNRATSILTLPDITALGGAGVNQVVQGRLLTRPNALVGFPAAGAPIKYSYFGSPYFFTGNSSLTSIAMYLMITFDSFWRPVNAANAALNVSASFSRYLGHLTPE